MGKAINVRRTGGALGFLRPACFGIMSYRPIQPPEVPALHPVAQIRDVWPTLAGAGGAASWRCFDPFDHPTALPRALVLTQHDPADADRLRPAVFGGGCRQTFGC